MCQGERSGDLDRTFTFRRSGNRELPLTVAIDGCFRPLVGRDCDKPAPSAPDVFRDQRWSRAGLRRLPASRSAFRAGLVYQRVPDLGRTLGVNIGRDNCEEVRYE